MKKYTLGQEDLLAIAKGAAIAVGGALLTYLATVVGQVDFGTWTPLVVAVAGILINAGRKVLDGESK